MKPPSDRTRTSPDDPKKSAGRQGEEQTDGEGDDEDEWDPQPAELREGETPDEDSHARRNAEQLRMAREELERLEAEGEEGPGADE